MHVKGCRMHAQQQMQAVCGPAACTTRRRRATVQLSTTRTAPSPPRAMGSNNGAGPRLVPKRDMSNANFPMDAEGRTYHIGAKKGEVANRLLSVGPERRALMLAEYLQPLTPGGELFMLESRGFPNMDFVIREARAVVEGRMAVLRLGTCGAFRPPARLGTAVVASPGSVFVRRDPDAFTLGDRPPYHISQPVPSDPGLSALVAAELEARLGGDAVCAGLNVSADSFYSSQGRGMPQFDDRNSEVIAEVLARYPEAMNMEMETFHALDLARCSRGSIVASAVSIVLADRRSNDFLSSGRIEQLERACGQACLAALAAVPLEEQHVAAEGGAMTIAAQQQQTQAGRAA